MVGSAVGIDDSSRAERKRQMHIEAKISQNLRSFEDGAAVQTSVGFLFSESEARTVSESRSLEVVETMIMICPGWRLQITRHALLNSAIVCLRGRHGRQCIEILHCALALSTSMVHTLANHRGESAEGGKPGILHTDDQRYWVGMTVLLSPRDHRIAGSHDSSQLFTITTGTGFQRA